MRTDEERKADHDRLFEEHIDVYIFAGAFPTAAMIVLPAFMLVGLALVWRAAPMWFNVLAVTSACACLAGGISLWKETNDEVKKARKDYYGEGDT